MFLRNSFLAAAALLTAAPAMSATYAVDAGDYHVVARTAAERPGYIRLNIAVQRVAGGNPAGAVTLHAFFLDADGMILGPAEIGRTQANGLTLTADEPALRVPEGAATLAVLAEPAKTQTVSMGAQAAPATALIPLD